jgi:hypothetical protein
VGVGGCGFLYIERDGCCVRVDRDELVELLRAEEQLTQRGGEFLRIDALVGIGLGELGCALVVVDLVKDFTGSFVKLFPRSRTKDVVLLL